MRYVMYGAGAIGGSLGARLHESGRDVLLIARSAHGAAIAAHGLRFVTPARATTLRIPVVERADQVDWRSDDVVFLTMKGQDTESALRALVETAPAELPVVCAQNGVENERLALRSFANVHAMCVKLSATYLEPGLVQAYGAPLSGVCDLGRFPRGIDAVDERIADDLRDSQCLSVADPDVMCRKYAKLLINTTNAVETATGAARGSALSERVRAEAIACFRAHRIAFELPPGEDERNAQTANGQIDGHGYPGNSTWQSIVRGAGVEVDLLNGEISLLGRLAGIPTPANALLQQVVHRMARERIAPGNFDADALERELAGEPVRST